MAADPKVLYRPEEREKREVTVVISVQGEEIRVEVEGAQEPFWVKKHANQEVRWVLKTAEGQFPVDFLVDFGNDSPFYESQFSQDSPVSGLVRRNILPNQARLYKYTVWVGDKKLDPGGGVKP